MVLFLFVIMLVNLERSQKEEQYSQQWLAGILASLALGGLLVGIYVKGNALLPVHTVTMAENTNTQEDRHVAVLEIICSPSRSLRCCCWWRLSERW